MGGRWRGLVKPSPIGDNRRMARGSPTMTILAAMPLGCVAGIVVHLGMAAPDAARLADGAGVVAELFLRLIRAVIAPLLFATLAGGIAGLRGGGGAGIARPALLAVGWFTTASLVSLALGLLAANLLRPGAGLHLSAPHGAMGAAAGATSPVAGDMVTRLVPTSIVDAMARNDLVQIVVFACLFGIAAASLPEDGATRVRAALGDLAAVMLRLTALVMRLAPVAVLAALLATFARGGPAIAGRLAVFIAGYYATMLTLWALLAGAGLVLLGRALPPLLGLMAAPVLLAFGTASSEAAFPLMVERLERFGVPPRLVGFVLPLGYAFNLDGAMLFLAFGALFVAQAYGIPLTPGRQVLLLLALMVASKGSAGVPRAAIVALASVLPAFGLPDAGLLLILGVDHLLDMGRSGTNVIGNALATAVVARYAGEGWHDGGRTAAGAAPLHGAGGPHP